MEESRYSRQLMLQEIGEEGQRRLAQARVLIVGAGGLGSNIATCLAGAGVGTIGLADDDVVSLSNLHRQTLYAEGQEGRAKVDCARERLEAFNGSITVNTYNTRLTAGNAEELIGKYDVVMDATDNFKSRYLLSDICVRLGKPMVYGAIEGLDGQVSVFCKGHATYRTLCPDEAATLSMPHHGKAVAGVTPAVVGSVQASQALQLICGYGTPLIDRLWAIDLRTMFSVVVEL
ncbi:MAG: HesA/MoeB/ThiF family protein [Bacteroidales bacterium]|nr:HesA/MoeB/ThiF family protein [Bacteroidales bacterium]MCM1146640.1 HesA/MoeB/ThiF family protein [Bacteroidales bacterium]MCM1206032.1 HesA/MoeB/ThiF family protein [Bacillota bacterium]MCM1511067.1 HesA/MoeB/ThiF family protein [Clostridium sp.]